MPRSSKYSLPIGKKGGASKKRLVLLSLLGLAVVLAILIILDRRGAINLPILPDKAEETTSPSNGINYGPATEQEKKETEAFKENLGDQSMPPPSSNTSPSSATSKKVVTPIMTTWGASPSVEVRGYIPSLNEEGGICTVNLTKGDQKVTESRTATADATTVSCGLITIARDRLSAGTWTATLAYASNSAEGTSTSNSIEVE